MNVLSSAIPLFRNDQIRELLAVDLVDVSTEVPPPFRLEEDWILDVQRAELAVDLAATDMLHRDWAFGRPVVMMSLVAWDRHGSVEWCLLDGLANSLGATAHLVVVLY